MKIIQRRRVALILAILSLCLAALPALARVTPGDIDPGFNGGTPAILDHNSTGHDLSPTASAIDPINDDIILAGTDTTSSTQSGLVIAYKTDGTLDTAVGNGGIISITPSSLGLSGTTPAVIFASVAVDSAGRILVAGYGADDSTFEMVLARFNADGTLDTSFGTNGIVTSQINAGAAGSSLSLAADGHIIVAGISAATATGTGALLTLWRFNSDGTPDTSLNGTGHVQIDSISLVGAQGLDSFRCSSALEPNNDIIVGCRMTGDGGPWKIVSVKSDGSSSNVLITSAPGMLLNGLALAPDGGFYVTEVERVSSGYQSYLLRYLASGAMDPDFNGGSPVSLGVLATDYSGFMPVLVQPDGKVLIALNMGSSGSSTGPQIAIGRLLPNGTLDAGFGGTPMPGIATVDFSSAGSGYIPYPTNLLLQGDGSVVATGSATPSSGGNAAAFATRVLNDAFDLTPDAVSFDPLTDTPLDQAVVSNAVSLSGIGIGSETTGIAVALQVQNGQYSTTGTSGPFMGTVAGANAGWVKSGDSLALAQLTPATGDTDASTNVSLGGFWAPNNYQIPLGTAVTTAWNTTTDTPPTANDATLAAKKDAGTKGTLDASAASGVPLTFSIVTTPAHGTVTLSNATTGAYTYTPNSGYTGADKFTWKVNDGIADSNIATVTVSVTTNGGKSGNGSGGGGGLAALSLLLLLMLAMVTIRSYTQRFPDRK